MDLIQSAIASFNSDQGVSWFRHDREFSPDGSQHVARIHFPTDVDTLDAHDQMVLRDLARHYQKASRVLGSSYRLALVGRADRRGSDRHNIDLAHRRVMAVRDYLAPRLKGKLAVSEVMSTGKRLAHRRGDAMREDRAVDLYLETIVPEVKTEPPTRVWVEAWLMYREVSGSGRGLASSQMTGCLCLEHHHARGRIHSLWFEDLRLGGGGIGWGGKGGLSVGDSITTTPRRMFSHHPRKLILPKDWVNMECNVEVGVSAVKFTIYGGVHMAKLRGHEKIPALGWDSDSDEHAALSFVSPSRQLGYRGSISGDLRLKLRHYSEETIRQILKNL